MKHDRHLSKRIEEINKQISLLNKTFDVIRLVECFLADTIKPDATSKLRDQFDTVLKKARTDKDDILKIMNLYNKSDGEEVLQKNKKSWASLAKILQR
ncbi:MAG: hypothetical protein LBS71_02980 [Puniceicoccales bacterium]|nr:hypothetical protein [Puniceicoccales bacterium]